MSNIEVFSGLVEKNGVKMMGSKALCMLLNQTKEAEQNEIRLDNVIRDTRQMLEGLFDLNIYALKTEDGVFIEYFVGGLNNGKVKEFFLNEELSVCYVSGKRPKVRLAIIKAFAEAKRQIEILTQPQQPQFVLPKTFTEALRMLADSEDEKERLALAAAESKAQLESLEKNHVPMTVAEACKNLGFRPIKTMAYLREAGFFTKLNQPCSSLCGKGFFEVCSTKVSDTRHELITRVTGEGLVWMDSILRRGLPAECFESLKKECEQLKKEAARKKDRDIGYENKRGDHRVLM